jgi:hypothetical protein
MQNTKKISEIQIIKLEYKVLIENIEISSEDKLLALLKLKKRISKLLLEAIYPVNSNSQKITNFPNFPSPSLN